MFVLLFEYIIYKLFIFHPQTYLKKNKHSTSHYYWDEQPMDLDLLEDSIQFFRIFELLQRMKINDAI